jgi:hypothetical protein
MDKFEFSKKKVLLIFWTTATKKTQHNAVRTLQKQNE